MGMKLNISHRLAALILGMGAFFGVVVSLMIALAHGGAGKYPPASIPAIAAPLGLLVALFFAKRLYAWFFCLTFGLLTGLSSALQIVFGPPVETEFDVAFLTVVIFAALGFLVGAFAEFIWQIHRVSHKGLRGTK